MARPATLAVAVLALALLATAATSVDTVSTSPQPEAPSNTVTATPKLSEGDQGSGGVVEGPDGEGTGSTDTASPNTAADTADAPLWQAVVGAGLLVLGGLVVLFELTGGDDVEEPPPDRVPVTAPGDSLGSARGLAENLPPTNEVYRAWGGLREQVPLPADAEAVPATVAAAAISLGYPRDEVARLTELFCAVRYGDASLTEDRERRARELAAVLALPRPATEGTDD